ncbi:hypothetical protein JB92DRAFT_2827777 [Gautieria morchelliformis]|nr:hypothetical protein JB92DRAFT_2827777 [Gautieria morchelliformis]
MVPKLDTLPNDILIHVWRELDVYHDDIHRCSLTCRIFHETIRDTLLLRYRLEFAVAGLEDESTECRLSVAERLAQLKTIEEGWANLSFRQKLSNVHGGVLTWRLDCLSYSYRLPYEELLCIRWQIANDIEVNILYFAIYPAQDLAVLVGWPVFGIHLRTMSTGAYRPCASDPVLACAVTLKDPPDHFVIQIMGDCLAILHDTPAGCLRDITLEASSLATACQEENAKHIMPRAAPRTEKGGSRPTGIDAMIGRECVVLLGRGASGDKPEIELLCI